MRGGVTIGRIYCDQGICFGPALTQAYHLEQSAVQPMIVIDPAETVQDYFLMEEQYGAFSGDGAHTYNLFAKTGDGRLFIDFLRPDACTNPKYRPLDIFNKEELPTLLEKFSADSSNKLDVREKRSWLQRYAHGGWRENSDGGEFVEINFDLRNDAVRRRLTPKNYWDDFS